jgi:hypothetical protein
MPYKRASKLAYFGPKEKFFETRAVFPELRGIFSGLVMRWKTVVETPTGMV